AAHWRSAFEWYAHEAVGQIGAAGMFELLTLVGYYATLALQLRVFRVPAPDGTDPDGTARA
ncbi:MAG TPA: hypothetical protein VJ418_30330, partial [Streptosporangiaceae bacterium]|nr:hypothetical protein [Streptosporangiaceae bacterium]